MNTKKSSEEKAKTRHEQNQRAAKRKAEQGLMRVSLWLPRDIIDQVKDHRRVGVVFAPAGVDIAPCGYILEGKKLKPIIYQANLEPPKKKAKERKPKEKE